MRIIVIAFLCFFSSTFLFADNKVPKGIYLELYYGQKSGGPSMHNQLIQLLSKDQELLGFSFFCIKGYSRAADSNIPSYVITRERRLPPLVTKQCKGSGAILMGPVQGENLEKLKEHLSSNYMHLYSDIRPVE